MQVMLLNSIILLSQMTEYRSIIELFEFF